MVPKNSWVMIENVLLSREERSENIPEDTRSTDLMEWCKGYTLEDSDIGLETEIVTITGRHLRGFIKEINPGYDHGFGEFLPEILYIGLQAREILSKNE